MSSDELAGKSNVHLQFSDRFNKITSHIDTTLMEKEYLPHKGKVIPWMIDVNKIWTIYNQHSHMHNLQSQTHINSKQG